MMNKGSKFLQCITLFFPVWIVCESSTLQEIISQKKMDKTIRDIFYEPFEEEGRFFYGFDREIAFNTSVEYSIPVVSFVLPGATEAAAIGLDSNSFGAITFVTFFLLGGIAASIYTNAQERHDDEGGEGQRTIQRSYYFYDSRSYGSVFDFLSDFQDVLNIESCTQLCICSAHAEPEKYGMLSWPFRALVLARTDESDAVNLSSYEKAALFGSQNVDECYEEYPCIVQPLDFVMYLKDIFLSTSKKFL